MAGTSAVMLLASSSRSNGQASAMSWARADGLSQAMLQTG